ncbi:MAG TPA: hypothetical protein P5256_01640 [Beijerinckiaceae bacterium]|nr:hypothetical protein [Rhodoblastus sp.]MCC2106180.1 hypothetical protein [Hyphomicrobiales bacterium]HRY01798.1 hypothetical protein [Beijerinckiaceae bacterium]
MINSHPKALSSALARLLTDAGITTSVPHLDDDLDRRLNEQSTVATTTDELIEMVAAAQIEALERRLARAHPTANKDTLHAAAFLWGLLAGDPEDEIDSFDVSAIALDLAAFVRTKTANLLTSAPCYIHFGGAQVLPDNRHAIQGIYILPAENHIDVFVFSSPGLDRDPPSTAADNLAALTRYTSFCIPLNGTEPPHREHNGIGFDEIQLGHLAQTAVGAILFASAPVAGRHAAN